MLGLTVRLGAPGHQSVSGKGKERAPVLLSLFPTPLQSLLYGKPVKLSLSG